MCAIAGIINLNKKPVNKNDLEKMIKIVKYRGPDDEGYFLDNNIGLGHCRLSILDLSRAGHQPMANEDKTLWIVYNGEIYNYLELRKELENLGYRFKSNTDTEVILYSYQEWGMECLHKFNGMWAFAIWDKKKKMLFCSRDRFGIKPFYYFYNKNIFAFSSEIKQLLTLKDICRSPNDNIIYDYLVFGLENHTEETFFKNIKQLLGGCSITINLATKNQMPEIKRWYLFFEQSDNIDFFQESKRNFEHFYELLEDSIRLRLRSDVPIGSCLSGGLDSSTIVCLANKILKNYGVYQQEVFTSCFKQKNIDERKYAEKIIKKTGCVKNLIFPDLKTLENELDNLVWHQEEPFGGLSIFSQWCVMKAAKQKGIKVLLDGQGGDELLLGYERYYVYFLKELLKQIKFHDFLYESFLISNNSRLSYKQLIKYFVYFSFPKIRLNRLLNQANKILNKDFSQLYRKRKILAKEFINIKNLADLQKKEILFFQLPHLLRYEDRNSMAFSIEARVPFLDYRLIEFVYKLPPEYKIKNGWTKYILRKSMGNILPDSIRWRKRKIGFEVPQKMWIEMLKTQIKEMIFQNDFLKKYINTEQTLKQIELNKISIKYLWRIYNLGLWIQKFVH